MLIHLQIKSYLSTLTALTQSCVLPKTVVQKVSKLVLLFFSNWHSSKLCLDIITLLYKILH